MYNFKDEKGNRFTWKINCIPIPVEPKEIDCIHCYGSGRIEDPDFFYDDRNCDFCLGSGKRPLTISCYDKGLEKYLEKFIDQYYKEQITNFFGENI
jgi:hypothetical protein